jgi:hypothetical protein
MTHKSYVNTRVILKMNIYTLWKTRRNWQEVLGREKANRFCNTEIREAIQAYREILNYTISL